MKVNRKVTRLAASVLATTMFACATALPAMALETPNTTFEIKKDFQIPENVFTPGATFNFYGDCGNISDVR